MLTDEADKRDAQGTATTVWRGRPDDPQPISRVRKHADPLVREEAAGSIADDLLGVWMGLQKKIGDGEPLGWRAFAHPLSQRGLKPSTLGPRGVIDGRAWGGSGPYLPLRGRRVPGTMTESDSSTFAKPATIARIGRGMGNARG